MSSCFNKITNVSISLNDYINIKIIFFTFSS